MDDLAEALGLDALMKRPVEVLSGGQQQRVAIARALAGEPRFLLADEPTGNLDEKTAESVIALLDELIRGTGGTMIMATHSTTIASTCDRTFELHDGNIVEA